MGLLEVKNVHSGYGRVPVLHGVSLAVEEGEMVAVLGPNGAGKTTLMSAIFGLLPLMEGEIKFEGRPINGLSPHIIAQKGIGYVPQQRNIFSNLTVRENLEMGGFLLKDPGDRIGYVYQIFSRLKERSGQLAGTLSGGERQMLAIGSALIMSPKLLILDEPISGLSPQVTEMVCEKICEINNAGTAILWVVEENPRQVLAHSRHACMLESGVIKRSGTGREFLEDEYFEEMFLGQKIS